MAKRRKMQMRVQDDPEFKKIISELESALPDDDDDDEDEDESGGIRVEHFKIRKRPKKISIEEGRELIELYNNTPYFMPGDVVQWKPGFRNRAVPDYDEPMVVFDKLEVPITMPEGMQVTMAGYADRNDLIGAFKDPNDGEILLFLFDSRRFMRYTG